MKILVLGTGGREHAIAWKLAQSPQCETIYLHPGNPGAKAAGLSPLPEFTGGTDPQRLAEKAKALGIDLVVIGPEVLLAAGCADVLRAAGLDVVGPNRDGAQLETSKIYAKEFMVRAKIPTASFFVAEDDRELFAMLADRRTYPIVIKLDGLAAGKGVVIAQSMADVEAFADRIWAQKEFGQGPHRVLVEEFIEGKEISYIGLCDGNRFIPLSSATDYKRVGNHHTGPNTGGMGSISPSALLTSELKARIDSVVIAPILAQLRQDGIDYRGALYVGLMIDDNGQPSVLEFNARFGDPETQALMLRLETDFADLLRHTARGTLAEVPAELQWTDGVSLYVVGAAEGYPTAPRLGDPISGIDAVDRQVQVFFSGVTGDNNKLSTGGGRVLGLGTVAATRDEARDRIYRNLQRINWKGIHYRDDIGL
jgi:phosphoribosylamine--glycine ligase